MKKNNTFLIKLGLTFIMAFLTSRIGAFFSGYSWIQDALIMSMYLGLGLSNDFSILLKGISNIRLYSFTQSSIFIVAPIVSVLLYSLGTFFTKDQALIGLLFVGCLPTTITSCIMLTQHSKGNTVGSVYNAMLAQLLAVVVSPFILSFMLRAEIGYLSTPLQVILKLSQRILLPLFVGQMLRLILPKLFNRIGKSCERISFNAIFGILYLNLSSLIQNTEGTISISSLILSTFFAASMFVIMVHLNWFLSAVFKLPLADRISSAYTGTQKTLAMGVPLAAILFPHNVELISQITIVIIGYYVSSLLFSVPIVDSLVAKQNEY